MGEDSPERQLVEKGRGQAERAGQLLARMGVELGRALSSPYDRARQTAEVALNQLPQAPPLRILSALEPGGSTRGAIEAICSGESDVLAVGHEPLLSDIAVKLAGDGSLLLDLRKGGLVELELVSREPYRAVLLGVLRPRHLR